MTLPRYALPAAIFVVIAILVLGFLFFGQGKGKSADEAGAMRAVAVRMDDIEETVTAQGKLEPKEYVDVGVQVSGQLDKIYVEIGDTVKAGDLIAEIDPTVYESRVAADEAQLKSLNAQLAEQEANAVFANQQNERNRRLIKAKAISQEALEDTQAALKVAQAKVNSLKAQIEQQTSTLEGDQANLSYTKIFAPMEGTIVSQSAREGQTLNANQTAPIIVQVANLDVMTVRTQVAEADVTRLKPGMDVYFTTLGALDRKWHGTVAQILPTPETINDVVLYNALVDVENKDRQLMTGMSCQVFFVSGSAKNVPVIPARALGKRMMEEDNGKGAAYQVRVQAGGKTEDRIVHIGLMTRNVAEVKEGLGPDDKVLVARDITEKPRNSGSRAPGAGRGPRL